jgi:hypothetical protein
MSNVPFRPDPMRRLNTNLRSRERGILKSAIAQKPRSHPSRGKRNTVSVACMARR